MKPINDTRDIPTKTDELNERAAKETAVATEPALDPEVPDILIWDEPPETIEQQQSAADPQFASAGQ